MGELVRIDNAANVEAYRASTNAAEICREIVVATASKIQGKSYVCVEGWQAIALAHGCAASADEVTRVTDEGMSGFRATGIVRRMSDGAEIARAEGFLGDDEQMWAKRPVYARRAMVQTRAISRACRSAFAHVVVMMKANLSTTPAEEVPYGGFDDSPARPAPQPEQPARQRPAPLTGKHKTRAAARVAYGEIVRELHACEDESTLDAYLLTIAEDIEQFKSELPSAWQGDGHDFIGLEKEIERARAQVTDESWKTNPMAAG